MANVRIKDLTTTAAATASDDFFAVDGVTNGTRKLSAASPVLGGTLSLSSGATTSALTDLLINPTTKASGNLIDAQVGGVSKFYVTSAGNVFVTGTGAAYTAIDTGAFVKIGNDQTSANVQIGGRGASACIQGAQIGSASFILSLQPYGGNLAIGNSGTVTTIAGTTASTSTTTGALVVSGGAGFAKNIYVDTVGIGTGGNAGSTNICIGTVNSLTTGSENTIISYGGGGAGALTTGNSNTVIGLFAGRNMAAASSNNTLIGQRAGLSTTGSSNVMIGRYAGGYETGSNTFYVDNQDRTDTAGDKAKALLYGTFNATAANQTLTINAATTVSNTTDTTGTGSGALQVSGGAYVAKRMIAGTAYGTEKSVTIDYAVNTVTNTTLTFTVTMPSPNTVSTFLLEVGVYGNSGSGYGSLFVKGGGYVGSSTTYDATELVKVNNGNVTISSVTKGNGSMTFTVLNTTNVGICCVKYSQTSNGTFTTLPTITSA